MRANCHTASNMPMPTVTAPTVSISSFSHCTAWITHASVAPKASLIGRTPARSCARTHPRSGHGGSAGRSGRRIRVAHEGHRRGFDLGVAGDGVGARGVLPVGVLAVELGQLLGAEQLANRVEHLGFFLVRVVLDEL